MASYAAVASVMELLEDILHRNQYPNLLLRRHQILESLHKTFALLLDSLKDYSSKADEADDRVERRIRDVAYEAQDIIESEIAKQNDSELGENRVLKKIFHLVVLACQSTLRLQLGWAEYEDELEKVGREVHSVVEEVKAIKETQTREDLEVDYAAADVGASEQTPSDSNKMVGFDKDVLAIQEQLCGESSQLEVIPIVGMAGIGKTTLARNTFDSTLIRENFDFHGWVTISQDYDVIRVLRNIIISLAVMTMDELREWENKALEESQEKKGEMDNESKGEDEASYDKKEVMDDESKGEDKALDEHEAIIKEFEALIKEREKKKEELEKRRRKKERALKDCIYKHLKDRKYLIVVDDVWRKEVWVDLKQAFPNDKHGSRILLTTRLIQVAEHASTFDFIHKMQLLDEGASWKLLQEKVFGQEPYPNELENIGRFIASKCQGLPLAIVVIAGILSNFKTLEYWNMIARTASSVLSRDDVLSLSYNHLPHPLKACFLHMGSFPEDYEINISKLIRLWIAEGFLKSANKFKSLEKIGEEYLEDLVKRSLVIVTKKRIDGQLKSCIIHDVLRDFCRQRGLHECFFHDKDQEGLVNPRGVEKARRVLVDSTSPYMPWAYDEGKYVRSICWFSKTSSNVHSLEWGAVKMLKILDIADIETFVAPFAVSQMFHLKYLALRLCTKKKKHLPPSIFMFQNLQTMIIHAPRCESISLPPEIWKMPHLRHLIIDRMILPSIPMVGDVPLQKLEYLQTLETVEDFVLCNKVIWMIPNIRKLKLSFRGLEASGIWELHCLNNLVSLLQLEKLNITFDAVQFSYVDSFRSSFLFPKNLKMLSLEGCRLPWEELTVVGSLPCLQVLRLRKDALVGEEWAPREGEFPELKFLLMESLDLQCWRAENMHFPCLEHLKINKCSELEGIPLEIGEINSLKFIEVYFSERAGNSANQILNEQRYFDNNELQVLVRD